MEARPEHQRDQAGGDLDFAQLERSMEGLRRVLARLEPRSLSGVEAARAVELFAQAERLGAAGKTLAARAVERSGAWHGAGHRSAAHWMAQTTGVPVGQAVGALQTARRLEHLPATAAAFAAGDLSEPKVREVAAASTAVPEAEPELLAAARTQTVVELTERCRRIRARAEDAQDRYERIRKGRYLRHWTDGEGAFRLDARLTPDDGAQVLAGLEPHRARIAAQARKAGVPDPAEAQAADALVAMARTGAGDGPVALVQVRVDREALVRGRTGPGEVCEIPGIGPIPVGVARDLAADAVLTAVLAEGADVRAVAHLGRTIPARLRTALAARDPACVVPGCEVREGLQIDHRIPWAEGGPTSLKNLSRLCRFHHAQKTHHGYRLGGGPGGWTWTGPDGDVNRRWQGRT